MPVVKNCSMLPICKKDTEMLEPVQRRATELGTGWSTNPVKNG